MLQHIVPSCLQTQRELEAATHAVVMITLTHCMCQMCAGSGALSKLQHLVHSEAAKKLLLHNTQRDAVARR